MMRVIPKGPRGWTKRQWSPYAGYAVRLVEWKPDVYGQHLFEILEGPLQGEQRWFKPTELVYDKPECADGDA